ncbi:adipocyte plasma membrane-associated protein-like isoform X2 [Ostrea edulis]|uniref:adipocyte plasma membrane-associated protein-like isoform X2 n=1 Tax=Ostrea edulis TaxID=37623 RepID=UPI002095E20D|nr:adipocyte plasma membrane-associated protein-like isoform X2 [Ostrea edulis]XP_055998762.1 adipocyte plasma membrane-associated protein-like isoform X2 [Ostrea edulis]XP_055998764.1 adipocyte plasma membrane-associated protein-like isoform X2 [Ostrea edulis]
MMYRPHAIRFGKAWILSLVTVWLAVCIYHIPPPIEPLPHHYPKPLPVLEGPLAINAHLQNATKAFQGEVIGPESFAVAPDGTMYTGLADGRIVGFKGGELWLVTRTGAFHPDCGTFDLEPVCGRPKGMKINLNDPSHPLIVVDSYRGLLQVDTKTGDIKVLLHSATGLYGEPFKFLNSLDITKDGIIYFTDSSKKWDRRNYRYEVIEVNRQGRLMQYNTVTKETKLLLDKLYLANGVALSSDETMLVISEMSVCQIRRYFLKGPKAGQSDIITQNLPGYPDNIKLNSRGNFYVGMGSVRYQGVSLLGPFLDLIGPYPSIKRFLTKITPLRVFDIFMPKHSIILEIDMDGNIVNSLHDHGAKVIRSSGEGFEFNNTLYIGSFWTPYIGMLNLTRVQQIV